MGTQLDVRIWILVPTFAGVFQFFTQLKHSLTLAEFSRNLSTCPDKVNEKDYGDDKDERLSHGNCMLHEIGNGFIEVCTHKNAALQNQMTQNEEGEKSTTVEEEISATLICECMRMIRMLRYANLRITRIYYIIKSLQIVRRDFIVCKNIGRVRCLG